MDIGIFTDKNIRPTAQQINIALGHSYARWQSLAGFLHENYSLQEDFKFLYGSKYGWALRLRNKGKQFISLFPNENHFVVQIILNQKALIAAARMKLHSNALKAIKAAKLYPEGKWLFIPIKFDTDMKDIKELLRLKAAHNQKKEYSRK